jgi:hypothetical protein
MLKKLINLLPVSRRKYEGDFAALAVVIEGLVEADANHSQIEMQLMQQAQVKGMLKATAKKHTNGATNVSMYG